MCPHETVPVDEAVKPIVAVLTSDRKLMPQIIQALADAFGRCDYEGAWHPFAHSEYYEDEMGPDLWRCMVSFEQLRAGWDAPRFKEWTNIVETRFSERGKRRVNCDPGYVDHLKMTLVSGKCGGHKVLIAPGAWIDYLLWYNKGWVSFPWSFPDFRDGTYFKDLMEIRKLFKAQLAGRAS